MQRVVLVLLFSVLMFPPVCFAEEKTGKTEPSIDEKNSLQSVKELRRMDFKIKGCKCARELGLLRRRIFKTKGVIKASIIFKEPYGGAVVYDRGLINVDQIVKVGLKDEKTKMAKIVDINDRKIDKVPLILVPKNNWLTKKVSQ